MTGPQPALKSLLSGVLDYAGLFPPAGLPLPEALHNYANYLTRPERWMLGRFVVPAARLAELGALAEAFPAHKPFMIAALGRSGATRAGFTAGLAADMADIEAFRVAHTASILVDGYETRLPGDELGYQLRTDTLVRDSAALLRSAGLAPFFETPFDAHWQARALRVIAALAALPAHQRAGFKLRTGGLRPEHIPASRQVAWALLEAGKAGIPIKCTAGLHHPFRHIDPETGAMMHGFINVFTAGALAIQQSADLDLLAALIEDDDPANFRFAPGAISWKGLKTSRNQILEARDRLIVSFGSCSFLEPLEDLRNSQLLPT